MHKQSFQKLVIAIFAILLVTYFFKLTNSESILLNLLSYGIGLVGLLNLGIILHFQRKKYLIRRELNKRIVEINDGISVKILQDFANKGFSEDAARQVITGIYLSSEREDADSLMSAIAKEDSETLLNVIKGVVENNNLIYRNYPTDD